MKLYDYGTFPEAILPWNGTTSVSGSVLIWFFDQGKIDVLKKERDSQTNLAPSILDTENFIQHRFGVVTHVPVEMNKYAAVFIK